MSVLLIVGLKCTLAASHAAPGKYDEYMQTTRFLLDAASLVRVFRLRSGILPKTLILAGCSVFARAHQPSNVVTLNPVHTSNNVEATSDIVAKNGNNVERVLR